MTTQKPLTKLHSVQLMAAGLFCILLSFGTDLYFIWQDEPFVGMFSVEDDFPLVSGQVESVKINKLASAMKYELEIVLVDNEQAFIMAQKELFFLVRDNQKSLNDYTIHFKVGDMLTVHYMPLVKGWNEHLNEQDASRQMALMHEHELVSLKGEKGDIIAFAQVQSDFLMRAGIFVLIGLCLLLFAFQVWRGNGNHIFRLKAGEPPKNY